MKSLFVIVLSFLFSSATFSKTVRFEGKATNSKDEIVYLETHKAVYKDKRVQETETLYFSPDKKPIAELKSNYTKNLFVPDYTFKDFETGVEHIVTVDGNSVIAKSRKKQEENFQEKKFEIKDNMISGQGFNYFIIENLDEFNSDKNRDVRFVMPGLLDYFNFNIWPRKRDPASESNDKIINLKMTVNSWILKLFVTSIKMSYDLENRRLLTYEGVSNLETKDGKTQDVKIVYNY